MSEPVTDRRPSRFRNPLDDLVRRARPQPVTDDIAATALDEVVPTGSRTSAFLEQFILLIILSASIAAFGLIASSAAVVIGAMLVSPLMVPIMGTAAALLRGWVRGVVRSLATVALGVVLAFSTGYVVSMAVSDRLAATQLPAELLARTSPTLLDLFVAVAAGAAGGYVLVRREASGALPGVGIAVALVPPLATVGICTELGRGDLAWRAFLLFATNLAAIVFAAAAVLALLGFAKTTEGGFGHGLGGRLALAGIALIGVAVPLTIHTRTVLTEQRLASDVNDAVSAWDPSLTIQSLAVDDRSGVDRVELLVSGPREPAAVWRLADLLRERRGEAVDVQVEWIQQVERRAVSR